MYVDRFTGQKQTKLPQQKTREIAPVCAISSCAMRLVVGPLVVGLAGATEGCPRVRSDHFLLPTKANGYGNQYLALEKAAWLALATNRTLVLPPMLDHAGARAWGHWPPCGKSVLFHESQSR